MVKPLTKAVNLYCYLSSKPKKKNSVYKMHLIFVNFISEFAAQCIR